MKKTNNTDTIKLSNQEVIKNLNYYLSLSESPDYAVLINGPWGSGKTFFIKKFLKDIDNCIYISLYGISSIDEINTRICKESFLEIAKSKTGETGSKIAKKILTLVQSILHFFNIDINPKNLRALCSFTKDKLIIFDDLERSLMDIRETLGFINYFVEHQGNKVIIIANEDDIPDKENYHIVKEKLIGKTLTVFEELNSTILSVIETSSPRIKLFIETHLQTIKTIFSQSQCHNLRILKHILKNLERFCDIKVLKLFDEKSINYLLVIYLILSIESNTGNLKKGDMAFTDFSFEEKEKKGFDLFEYKYPSFYRYQLILEYDMWDRIIFDGWLEEKSISRMIKNSDFFHSKKRPEWKNLWHYNEFKSDHEFHNCYKKVKLKLDAKQYKDIYIIIHLAGMFMQFSQVNLIRQSPVQLYKYFCSYVDFLIKRKFFTYKVEDHLFNDRSRFDESHSHGLAYQGYDIYEFKEFISYLKKAHDNTKDIFYHEEANNLLQLIVEDIESFYVYISGKTSESRFNDIPILTYIASKKLVACLPKLDLKKLNLLFSALTERTKLYNHPQYASILEPEKVWIDIFKQQVEKMIKNYKVKIFRLKLGKCYMSYFNNQ
ncbi:KAP-like P-loop domain-containing protein [Frischella perrara]|uniref:KAP family P-loop domain protein n=1 Tax=Frischella perrara TaxID=1267021 RepID=A0A0A7S0Y7_FRIPE|nr:P-loop NTPase fold protein [Frischella perrara]AJA44492.1 KAP family P-loop domain protein [Frischella perrara]PWV65186.1 KAP-like P-loop domain-containing protein [Frischella perrara]